MPSGLGRPGRRRERWLKRVQGAVAASILLLGLMVVLPASGLDGDLAAAQDSLALLADELPDATPEEAVSLATTLVSQRAMLLSRHVDVTALDAQIAERLDPLLPLLTPSVARGLTGVLGELMTVQTFSPPTPAPPAAPPAETPGPDTTPAPQPSETISPPPDDTPTPAPSETPSPDPSETSSPDPSGPPSPPAEAPPAGDLVSPSPAQSS